MDVSVQTEWLREMGTRLGEVSVEGAREVAAPRSRITGDDPWGADEGGFAISRDHGELAAAAYQVLDLFIDTIDTVGANVRAMADLLETTDAEHGAALDSIITESGGRR